MRFAGTLLAGALALAPLPVRADITIGAVLSLTGPAASLGIPERNTVEMLPKTIAGQNVRYVVLDDGSDSTAAVRAAHKLIEQEHVDIILGPSNTPNSIALLEVVAQAGTPMVTLAGCDECVLPMGGARTWTFKLAPSAKMMMDMLAERLAKAGGKTVAQFAFATSFGDTFAGQMKASAEARGINTVEWVKYNPADTTVTPQALKVIAAKPDAIFIGASATPSALPLIELRNRGYAGPIFGNQGMASADLLRVGGKSVEGLVFPVSPVLVAEQLPSDSPMRPSAVAYVTGYEKLFGPGSRSLAGASMWDAFLLAQRAMPAALKGGEPGTAAFRKALRDEMEATKDMVMTQGIYTMTPADHAGSDQRALVLVEVKGGKWVLVQ